MSLAQQSLAMNDLGRAQRLLDAIDPLPAKSICGTGNGVTCGRSVKAIAVAELCRTDAGRLGGLFPTASCSPWRSRQGFRGPLGCAQRTRVKTLLANEGHFAAFSPQGDLLATGVRNEIRLWRPALGSCQPTPSCWARQGLQILAGWKVAGQLEHAGGRHRVGS